MTLQTALKHAKGWAPNLRRTRTGWGTLPRYQGTYRVEDSRGHTHIGIELWAEPVYRGARKHVARVSVYASRDGERVYWEPIITILSKGKNVRAALDAAERAGTEAGMRATTTVKVSETAHREV